MRVLQEKAACRSCLKLLTFNAAKKKNNNNSQIAVKNVVFIFLQGLGQFKIFLELICQ